MNEQLHSSIDCQLDEWLSAQPDNSFPKASDAGYVARYRNIVAFLSKEIHGEVDKQVMLDSLGDGIQAPEKIIYLTNHGFGHVEAVVKRASDLVLNGGCQLSPYEVYLLLVAIQFHDVGNILGRENHERKSATLMNSMGMSAGLDQAEKRCILRIAAAHCGNSAGGEGSIEKLEQEPYLLGQKVRPQLLAAILRMADELADDSTRASRYCMSEGLIPKGSEVFHAYSLCLHSVALDKTDIFLSYEFGEENASRTFGKSAAGGIEQVYLLDEVFGRIVKMHMERVYCSRFLRDNIRLDRIRCSISVSASYDVMEPVWKRSFSLQETGYPSIPRGGIASLCPELSGVTGKELSSILEQVERRE